MNKNAQSYQMIPFELKGDLQKFEEYCIPFFENLGVDRETAMVIIGSVWIFVNNQWRLPEGVDKSTAFVKQLQTLINMNSMENDSNTPDFILAQFMKGCLDLFNGATNARNQWKGEGTIVQNADIGNQSMEEAVQKIPVTGP